MVREVHKTLIFFLIWDQAYHKGKEYVTYKNLVPGHNSKTVLWWPPEFWREWDIKFLFWDYESKKKLLIRKQKVQEEQTQEFLWRKWIAMKGWSNLNSLFPFKIVFYVWLSWQCCCTAVGINTPALHSNIMGFKAPVIISPYSPCYPVYISNKFLNTVRWRQGSLCQCVSFCLVHTHLQFKICVQLQGRVLKRIELGLWIEIKKNL